jgi:hypothetical protein
MHDNSHDNKGLPQKKNRLKDIFILVQARLHGF